MAIPRLSGDIEQWVRDMIDIPVEKITNLTMLSDSEIIGLKYLIDGCPWLPIDSYLLESIRSIAQQMYDEIERRELGELIKKYGYGK